MEGGHGWLTRGSCRWVKVSCTGSRSPEMLVSPTVMPTTVSFRTCPVWFTSCVGATLPELSQQVASASGQRDAGNASWYLEHAKLLDVEDCHHHTRCPAAQGPEYLPGELDFACLPLLRLVQHPGALRWRAAVGGCLLSALYPPTLLQAQIQPCPGGFCSGTPAGAPRAEGENPIPSNQQQRGRAGSSSQKSFNPPSPHGTDRVGEPGGGQEAQGPACCSSSSSSPSP